MNHVRRILGFSLIPLFGIVSPLIALPAITSRFGAAAWATIALSTAVGGVLATAVELGWSWNGPMRLARAGVRSQRRQIAWAVATRATVLIPAIPIAIIATLLVASGYEVEGVGVALASTAAGMNLSWVFVGLGRPWLLVLLDAVPKLVAVAVAAWLLHVGFDLWVYPVVGLLAPALLLPVVVACIVGVRASDFQGLSLLRVIRVAGSQARVTLARVISTTYMQLPVVLFSLVSSVDQTALFAGGDRLARMTLSGVAPLPSMFQQWVGSANTGAARRRRAWRAVLVNVGVGLFAALCFAIFAPLASAFVFSNTATLDYGDAVLLGLMIAVVVASRAVGGLALVAAGKHTGLLSSAICGAVVGLPLILVLGPRFGATGGYIATLAAESAVLVAQTLPFIGRRKTS